MKLTQIGDTYFINKTKPFEPSRIKTDFIEKSFEFAYSMTFGEGHHRNHRTGGSEQRTALDIFRNTLQGKIAESVVFESLKTEGIACDPIDYSIHGKGIWDDADISYKDVKISVKSAAHFSNLLLLETQDWNKDGAYKPNNQVSKIATYYNYFVLVRIKPNTKSMFRTVMTKAELQEEIFSKKWYCDIPGCCSLKTLRYLIANDYVLPQNALLNGKIKMDAENYYIQAKDLKSINELIDILKST